MSVIIEQREIKYLIIGNTALGQYTSYNCPDPYSPSTTIDSKYIEALRVFETLYERAHANKKKPNVELKLKY